MEMLRDIGVNQMAGDNAGLGKRDLKAGEIWPRLYRYIYYRVQNREEAEELTQETFKRVHPRLASGELADDRVEAYCFATAKNLIAEVWRKRVRQPATVSMDELAGQGWEQALPVAEAAAEDIFLIREAFNRLSDDYRRVLTLRVIEGWPVKETARKMKRTPGAIRSLQFRAVQALKELLEEGGFFDE
jgi:RNA polymerase sigma-70 factor, ECF subfamily